MFDPNDKGLSELSLRCIQSDPHPFQIKSDDDSDCCKLNLLGIQHCQYYNAADRRVIMETNGTKRYYAACLLNQNGKER